MLRSESESCYLWHARNCRLFHLNIKLMHTMHNCMLKSDFCCQNAVWDPEPDAISESGKAELDSASVSKLHHAGVCQLLAEPECQQRRGAAVPPLQPDSVPPTGLLPLLQGECIPVPPLQVCILYFVLCTPCSSLCTLHSALCTLHSANRAWLCALHSPLCVMHSVRSALCTLYSVLYPMYCGPRTRLLG